MLANVFQDPAAAPTPEWLLAVRSLGWVDHTALAVILVFFVIGLFKGLIWQVSRIAILVLAYVAAGRFGAPLGAWLARTPAVGGTAPPPPDPAGLAPAAPATPETTLYLAYVLIFLVVLVAASLVAILLQRLAQKAGLGFFDRLGGGLLGVATGACVVLFGLFVVNMFFGGSPLAQAAGSSHALRLSRRAIDLLGDEVPDELRTVIALAPLRAPAQEPPEDGGTEPRTDVVAPWPGPGDDPAPAPPPPPVPQPRRQ
ncbi:MAG: CvpA family protein [Planctomycetes bacterium]|nr:CvpA family protein [Planctomycetota bacterium]